MSEEFSNVCLSGGADGADLEWGYAATRAGHSIIHWSYAGHRSRAPRHDIVELSTEQLAVADDHLIRANERVKRRVPFDKPWIINLLRRNYYQVHDAAAVYAVGQIKKGEVQGGTAWAVALFCDLRPGPVYVFDQFTEKWFFMNNGLWEPTDPPPPSGIYTGVGSRKLLPAGKAAIRNIFLKKDA